MTTIPKIGVINPPYISTTPFKDKMEQLDNQREQHKIAAKDLNPIRSTAKTIDITLWAIGLSALTLLILSIKRFFGK